jgi:4-amino-4-deoxy-L-arabinose transferase-like glycosyltransferase
MFTIGMISWFAWLDSERRRYLLLSYASLGLAVLAKGPVALFLAVAILVIFAAARRTPKILWRSLSLTGVLVFCVITLPWYGLVEMRNPQFFRVFILEHNLARFGTNLFHHPEPFWYYLPVTLLSWVPWTVFVVLAFASVLRRIRKDEPDSFPTFLLIWIVVVVVFFSISQSKLPGYVLPAIPAGILLLATYLRERATASPHGVVLSLHGAISAGLLLAALLAPATLLRHRLVWDRSDVLPLLVAIVAGIGVARAGIGKLRVSTAVPAVLALAIMLRLGAPALNQMLSARAVDDALARVSPRRLPVATVLVPRETEYGLQFYRDQKMPANELRQPIIGEHLIVAQQGFGEAIFRALPGRTIRYLGSLPAQKLEFFYVSP